MTSVFLLRLSVTLLIESVTLLNESVSFVSLFSIESRNAVLWSFCACVVCHMKNHEKARKAIIIPTKSVLSVAHIAVIVSPASWTIEEVSDIGGN